MRLGISSEDLQDLIAAWLEFNEEYEQQSRRSREGKFQNWGAKTPLRIKLGDKTSLFPFFSPQHYFHPDFLFLPQFGRN
jgi:hypothetical protein